MELINYLNEHYLTKQQLLDLAKISDDELCLYQRQEIMPKCSYRLALNYSSHSFFGEFTKQSDIEYYAKGYLSWLGIIKASNNHQSIFAIFAQRYRQAISELTQQGYHSDDAKVNEKLDQHIADEWQHFLNGTYGLCTKSGLPEDIAAKELAILQINETLALDEHSELGEPELAKLVKAVNLLDASSSIFAPHERANSSRHRLVDEVRRKYQLSV